FLQDVGSRRSKFPEVTCVPTARMVNMSKRTIAAGLLAVFASFAAHGVYAAETCEQIEKKIEEIDKRAEKLCADEASYKKNQAECDRLGALVDELIKKYEAAKCGEQGGN